MVTGVEKRQVFRLPEPRLNVSENQAIIYRCAHCRVQTPAEALAPLCQGPDRGETVRLPPGPTHRPFRRVHGHHEPVASPRTRRARLFQGLPARPEADDPRYGRRPRRRADLNRNVARQYCRRDGASAGSNR